jgi:hypothetical protein
LYFLFLTIMSSLFAKTSSVRLYTLIS